MGSMGGLEQLTCLGLPGEALVPELLAGLHGVIRSRANIFLWMNESADVVNAYAEDPRFYEALPAYFAEYYRSREHEVVPPYAEFMRQPAPVDELRLLVRDDRRLDASGFYNDILRPQGIYNFGYAKIRSGRRPLGMLLLGLDRAKPSLEAAERRRLARLSLFVEHGLARPKSFALDGAEGDEVGMMVFDREGKLLHLTAYARKLLVLAQNPRIGASEMQRVGARAAGLPAPLRRMCASLGHSLATGSVPEVPLVWSAKSAWGRITFRAYPLEPGQPAECLIGVAARQEVPRAVALWRRVAALGLPPRQAQVCFHLANGRTYPEIAREFGVSVNAVNWHVREIYGRLGVHSNAGLRHRLGDA